MPFVARWRQQLRARGGAFGLNRKNVEMLRLRRVTHILHDDAEQILGAAVHVIDGFRRILPAALDVGAAGHDPPRALLDEVQVVVVARRAERIVPRQKDRDLAVCRQRNHVVGLRSEAQHVGRVLGSLEQMQMADRRDAGDRGAIDPRIFVGTVVVLVGVVAHRGEVRADRKRRIVERRGRVARHRARAVGRLPEEPDVVQHHVVRRREEIDRLAECEVGVAVGERQLRAGREIVHDLEQRRPFGARSGKRTSGRGWRQPLEVAVGLKRAADDAAGRAGEHAAGVSDAHS